MKIRDFLIMMKIGTKFNIKKQYEIYQMVSQQSEITLNDVSSLTVNEKDCIVLKECFQSQKLELEIALNRQNSGILTIIDESYPMNLKEIFCPPTVLFYRGHLDLMQKNLAGIVGSRLISKYGQMIVSQLIPVLCHNKIVTVSGLAQGVDTLAHSHTIKAGGQTIAVIGSGLNKVYPRDNFELQKVIGRDQLLISEYPANSAPLRHHFVERNRIIAGLSRSLSVIEAKQHSGSLITANFALSENRNVLAVPGSLYSENSKGCNELISAGARPILSAEDIIEETLI
ncbi:DNA-processing protein DprA [Pediococcus argentinicus]|nr:DNA-processing protein DprA [Pediococcus argentinicus]NKZ21504.1 DNA-protecting protein DprA [Pediococcus argentinicus]GEP18697.1 DNA processing protein DprA [Pediococcus argentinicus]